MKKIDSTLKLALEKIKPEEKDVLRIEKELKKFLEILKKRVEEFGLDVEIFIGGSFAKKTVMKKESYDVDIFIRFDKKYREKELAGLTKKLLATFKDVKEVKGSRDYFQIKISKKAILEIIPVIKVKKPSEARNITDLSYSHVKYINKKIKSHKILDQILLAKAFCYSNGTYGAESYIKGFSGYSLELLIYYYKSLEKFLKALVNSKEKIIIDLEKKYRNKKRILLDINGSKLESPIVLIDPTFKQRNVIAALSEETFEKFIEDAKLFLKEPSVKFFEPRKIDLKKIKAEAKKNRKEFFSLTVSTSKQEGDIAGSKLLKFYNHVGYEISKYFDIKDRGFKYDKKKSSKFFFVVSARKEIMKEGPFVKDKENLLKFKKENKNTFVKRDRIYSKIKIDFSLGEFLKKWKRKNSKKIKEMYITKFNLN